MTREGRQEILRAAFNERDCRSAQGQVLECAV